MSARQALSLGLSRSGVKSYQVLTQALAALSEAGTPTPCAGMAANFTPIVCAQCPLRKLCRDHGTRFEETGIWGGSPAGRKQNNE